MCVSACVAVWDDGEFSPLMYFQNETCVTEQWWTVGWKEKVFQCCQQVYSVFGVIILHLRPCLEKNNLGLFCFWRSVFISGTHAHSQYPWSLFLHIAASPTTVHTVLQTPMAIPAPPRRKSKQYHPHETHLAVFQKASSPPIQSMSVLLEIDNYF